jgi:hypothetical protein
VTARSISRGQFFEISDSDSIAFNHEARFASAVSTNLRSRQLAALKIMIDAPGYKPAHFFIRENYVVGTIDTHTELLTRALHQEREVTVSKIR